MADSLSRERPSSGHDVVVPLLCVDLDDTLIDRTALFREWATGFASLHGRAAEFVDWLVALDAAGHRPRPEFWAAVRVELALAASAEELKQAYQRDFLSLMRCEEPVHEALLRARSAGYAIAIVTNGNAFQHEKIAATRLDGLVDAVIVSELEGSAKPDRRIFDIAAARTGQPLAGAFMIGDNPDADIKGAFDLGMGSVWLSLGRTWDRATHRPTYEAGTFAEAVDLVLGDPDSCQTGRS